MDRQSAQSVRRRDSLALHLTIAIHRSSIEGYDSAPGIGRKNICFAEMGNAASQILLKG